MERQNRAWSLERNKAVNVEHLTLNSARIMPSTIELLRKQRVRTSFPVLILKWV